VEAALLAFAGWLESVGIAHWARATPWAYPYANVLHVVGVAMLVGGIGAVDLRVAGLWRRLPLNALSRALTPVAVAGLVLQVMSGVVLFAADGVALSGSGTFHAKLGLIVVALANAAAFRLYWRRQPVGDFAVPPSLVRVSALLSLALWLAVLTLGRLIAYY
jgi:hypothetical protein